MSKVYVLKDAAQVNVVGGLSTLMMAGSVLPENTDKVQLQHLIDNGIAVEGEFIGGLEPVFTGDLEEQLTFRTDDAAAAGANPDGDQEPPDGPPAKSASKAEWVDYAVAQGATQDDAEGQTKDDLIAAYGSA